MGPALGVNLDDPHASLVVSFVLSGLVGCLSRWHASGETIPRGELAVLLQRVMAGVLTVLGSGRDGSSLYEERMARALGESRRDYSEGRVYASREELMEGIAQRRAARG